MSKIMVDTTLFIELVEKANMTWLITSDGNGRPIIKIYDDKNLSNEIASVPILS